MAISDRLKLYLGHASSPSPQATDDAGLPTLPPAECPPPFADWAAKLRSLSSRLKNLSRRTEGEFLSVGEGLRNTHGRAGKIAELSSLVAASMSGEEIDSAILGLRATVERMDAFLVRAEEETARDEKSLRNIRQILGGLRAPLKEFKKVVKFLRNLGISTKIESARMGENSGGFGAVAENVEKMSVLFETKSVDIRNRGAQLDSVITQTLSRLIEHQRGLRERARTILRRAGENLSALIETHGKCADAARSVMESSADVSRNVGEAVASMQFHDITRQQIEHVVQAVDDLACRLEAAGTGSEEVGLAGGVCRLQAAHLNNSRASMVKAIETMVASLRGIASTTGGIARKTREISGDSGNSGRNVLSEVEEGLSSVGCSLRESAAAVKEFSSLIRSIARTVGEMSSFMDDIREIGEEIELVAMNAEIKAAHTGSKGAALGVLAESIQNLSAESRDYRSAVSAALDNIRSAAGEMSRASGPEDDGASRDGEVEEIRISLNGLLASLAGIKGSVDEPLVRLDEAARALSEDIDRIVQGITAHDLVSETVDAVVAGLEDIEAHCRKIDPDWWTSQRKADLKALTDRYTMHEERDIHLAVMGGEAAPVAAAESAAGFGDNVELF